MIPDHSVQKHERTYIFDCTRLRCFAAQLTCDVEKEVTTAKVGQAQKF